MNIGDILFSLISLMLLILFIASPFFKKRQKTASPGRKFPESARKKNDNMIVSGFAGTDAGVQRTVKISTPADYASHLAGTVEKKKPETISVTNRIDRLPYLKKAVIWKEILSPPAALRDPENHDSSGW